ncbi:hypothetical protein AURDEDRAFT_164350 [Auricularia subglabra TFB-10046 SS5]|nr:hypothetical protein AURDEDRAFT_164350 [Auricularia subglabra TFB-10046 SS5]
MAASNRFESWPGFASKEPTDPEPGDDIEELIQQQMRLLEALYEARISTTNIWRAQGWFIRYPPRRTVQQEAQGAMQIYRSPERPNTAEWVEPGETLREDTIAEDAATLDRTNGRLHSTLIEELHNVLSLPVQAAVSSYLGRPGATFGPITPTPTPSRKGSSRVRRHYARHGDLGGYPLPEEPLPRPDFKHSAPSPDSGSASRTRRTHGSHRKTPYPTRTATSAALFESSPSRPRAGTPFEVDDVVHYYTDEAEVVDDAAQDELPSVASIAGTSKLESRKDIEGDDEED